MDQGAKILKTTCPLDCPDTCSILATVKEGRVTRLQGDPEHPFTRGFLCHKVANYDRRLYSPLRILHPLRRVGKPSIKIHSAEARAGNIAAGDRVRVFNDRGECQLFAEVTEDTREGVVVAESICWPKHMPGGRGINARVSTNLGGGSTFQCNLVEVTKQSMVRFAWSSVGHSSFTEGHLRGCTGQPTTHHPQRTKDC